MTDTPKGDYTVLPRFDGHLKRGHDPRPEEEPVRIFPRNWLSETGRFAFLMPRELANQPSCDGWRRLPGLGRRDSLVFHNWSEAGHPFDPIKEDCKYLLHIGVTHGAERGIGDLASVIVLEDPTLTDDSARSAAAYV